MSEIVNLRLARKRAERSRREDEAAANRAKHGLAKGERLRQASEAMKTDKQLDQAKRERDPDR